MVVKINLALQGGGAHGAFSWGVVDRLLEDDEIEIAGISGTSAGALNGAAIKAGLSISQGPTGRRAARENMAFVWSQVSQASDSLCVRWLYSMFPAPRQFQRWTETFSPLAWLENIYRFVSPYDLGPFYSNPLADIIRDMPHPRLDRDGGPRLFISATNVRTGRIRVFDNHEITADTIMASACLPTVFKAVDLVDPRTGQTEPYWDGGYSGNPALFPLYAPGLPRDMIIVNINPMEKTGTPKSPVEIADRINEISFNASLLSEFRAIHFVKRLLREDRLQGRPMKDVLLHMISDDVYLGTLGHMSKLMPNPGLVDDLFRAGRAAAEKFIEDHKSKLGKTDSFDVSALFS